MTKFGDSQFVRRVEDLRLLTGSGRFVDDIAPADALHALFLRSSVAHGEITELDVSAARDAPGVHLVLTAADLEAGGVLMGMHGVRVTGRGGSLGAGPERPVLARKRLRFVGEPIAMVVAETLAEARDALDLVTLDFKHLDAKIDLAEGGPEIHAEAPGNLAFDWEVGDAAATEAALANAAHRVSLRIEDNRIIVNSIEPRGAYAEWADGRLHFCFNGQGVWNQKAELARMLRLPIEAVRVTNPDVGGGFGMKAMTYPEYVVIAQAARQLGRPVRWMSERTEAMLSDNAGRDLVSVAELGFDADYRISGYRVDIVSNIGAYNSQFAQAIQSELAAKVMTGVYDIRTAYANAKGVYTNTTPVDAYRGAGRPEANYTLERVMDEAARKLGIDPFVLREANFVRQFPYATVGKELYDVGDFPRVLKRVRAEADVAGFPARKAASAARGMLRGLGVACYLEVILGDPTEGARIEFNADGTVSLFVGTQSNGQGHETVFAQFLSGRTGIPFDLIRVVQGDSDRIKRGGGTGGSRSVTVQSTATLATIKVMIDAFTPFLEAELGGGSVTFDDGTFRAAGSNRTMTLIEAADLARSQGRTDLLGHERRVELLTRSYPNGAHICEVEVDPETGLSQVVAYTVTDDFGNLLNPQLAEGQVHGGIAQGIGQAMSEHVVFDSEGQLLTASFMDYAMPRAEDMPWVKFTTEPTLAPSNPLGMKGCGEAGTVGALGAVANAMRDALADRGVHKVDMPFTPLRVWQWLQEADAAGV